jgi:hypothetical protein
MNNYPTLFGLHDKLSYILVMELMCETENWTLRLFCEFGGKRGTLEEGKYRGK